MSENTIRCPSCGAEVTRGAAEEKGEGDPEAQHTCPTCGAGIDDEGNLLHEPAVGP